MSKSLLSVATDLRKLLLQDADLKQMVGESIFPLFAPADTTGDFVTIRREGYKLYRTKFGTYDEVATIAIVAFSPDYDRCCQIVERLRSVLMLIKVDDLYPLITNSTEDVTDFTVGGQAWYAEYLQVTVGT